MGTIYTTTDSQLGPAGDAFVAAATKYQALLGLLPGDILTLTGTVTGYKTSYTDLVNARALAKAATQTKGTKRELLLSEVRDLAKKIYASPSVTPAIVAEFGLPQHSGAGAPIIPVAPSDLVATAYSNGDTQLKWKGNGNKRTVVYWVEESLNGTDWNLVATLTKKRFTIPNQVVGQKKYFRVRATRNTLASAPSNTSVVYSLGAVPPLALAA